MYKSHIFLWLACIAYSSCSKPTIDISKTEVNVLLFKKGSKTPFTGVVEEKGEKSYYQIKYCKGLPCGDWFEKENSGAIFQDGYYLSPSEIDSIRTFFDSELIYANVILSRLNPNVPMTDELWIVCIMPLDFFKTYETTDYDKIDSLSRLAHSKLKKLAYNSLYIVIKDNVSMPNKHIGLDYELVGDSLILKSKSFK